MMASEGPINVCRMETFAPPSPAELQDPPPLIGSHGGPLVSLPCSSRGIPLGMVQNESPIIDVYLPPFTIFNGGGDVATRNPVGLPAIHGSGAAGRFSTSVHLVSTGGNKIALTGLLNSMRFKHIGFTLL